MVPTNRLPDALKTSRLLGGLAVLLTVLAAIVLLFPSPLADVFFAAWVLIAIALAVVGALGAWTRRTALVWVAALLLLGLTVVGMMSIGLFIAPAALALLGCATALLLAGPRLGAHEIVPTDPPSVMETVLKTIGGIVAIVLGGSLVYEGTFVRELFTRGCASETLECALAVTRPDAVVFSVLGLVAVWIGGWLVWKQVSLRAFRF